MQLGQMLKVDSRMKLTDNDDVPPFLRIHDPWSSADAPNSCSRSQHWASRDEDGNDMNKDNSGLLMALSLSSFVVQETAAVEDFDIVCCFEVGEECGTRQAKAPPASMLVTYNPCLCNL